MVGVEALYTGIIGVARTLFAAQGLDLTVRGARNIPARGGAVIVVNHTGYFDFVYAGIPARVHRRFIRYMAKVEVFEHAVTGPVMRELQHIPVDRTAGADSFREAVQRLRDGELVGVFPEATISRSFEIKQFKSGAVRMAAEADVPVIPITIWGSQRVWTKGLPKTLWRPKVPILIDVGTPMRPYQPFDECVESLRRRMQRTLESLQVEYARRYGPYPPGAPWVPARLGGSAPTLAEADRMDEAEHLERMRRRGGREVPADAAATDGSGGVTGGGNGPVPTHPGTHP